MMSKICSSCQLEFPATEAFFYMKKNRHGNRMLTAACRSCSRKRMRESYRKHSEQRKEYKRRWDMENPNSKRISVARRLAEIYPEAVAEWKDKLPLCACGCGEKVAVSTKTFKPNKFIIGHNSRNAPKECRLNNDKVRVVFDELKEKKGWESYAQMSRLAGYPSIEIASRLHREYVDKRWVETTLRVLANLPVPATPSIRKTIIANSPDRNVRYRKLVPLGDKWRSKAACLGKADLFFPNPSDNHAIAKAKALCAACPSRTDCERYASEHGETTGIWGGKLLDVNRKVSYA